MKILVGTSGWSYKEWKGSFYPPKLPQDEMLGFYASRFPTVEVNNSFYRIPSEKVLAGWAEQVPPDFRFVLKASRRITHNSRLADEDGSLEYFLRAANPLGERLGPTLFQLPPTFKKDAVRLRDFLARLPKRWMAALEFRHASWFDDEVYDLLRSRTSHWWRSMRTRPRARVHRWCPLHPGVTSGFVGRLTMSTRWRPGPAGSNARSGRRRTSFSSMRMEVLEAPAPRKT